MSWMSQLFGRAQRLPVDQIAGVVERIISRVKSVEEYRRELAKAAQSGDLDGPYDTWRAANNRARDFIKDG